MQWGAVTSLYLSDTKRNDTSHSNSSSVSSHPIPTPSVSYHPNDSTESMGSERGGAPGERSGGAPPPRGWAPRGRGTGYTPNAYPRGHRGRVAPLLNMYPLLHLTLS